MRPVSLPHLRRAPDPTDRTYACPGGLSQLRTSQRRATSIFCPQTDALQGPPKTTKGMAAARNRFLSGGPLRPPAGGPRALGPGPPGRTPPCWTPGLRRGAITPAGLYEALSGAGRTVEMAGVDISNSPPLGGKSARPWVEIRRGLRHRLLPAADRSADLLVNCFSPWLWTNSAGC